ncbi:MAG: hypothetical protein HFE73_07435 [Firmicutes bacterium]|nr:hypothetical protein [Bacillota bacterium]
MKSQRVKDWTRIKRDGLILLLGICLYVGGRYVTPKLTILQLQWFMGCYFNDILCGTVFMAYCDVFFTLWGKPLKRLLTIEGILLGCGLIWEGIVPRFLEGSTSDPWDVAAYLCGGLLYWLFMEKILGRMAVGK